ncbi:MAG TPA: hypothetical protein VMW16_15770 [Sedimentisphaerales bacterium]|nr:hypothetical protein [Sedimentisphaerales bacterium]
MAGSNILAAFLLCILTGTVGFSRDVRAEGKVPPGSHDANYFTFHRIPNFRTKTLRDKPLDSSAE